MHVRIRVVAAQATARVQEARGQTSSRGLQRRRLRGGLIPCASVRTQLVEGRRCSGGASAPRVSQHQRAPRKTGGEPQPERGSKLSCRRHLRRFVPRPVGAALRDTLPLVPLGSNALRPGQASLLRGSGDVLVAGEACPRDLRTVAVAYRPQAGFDCFGRVSARTHSRFLARRVQVGASKQVRNAWPGSGRGHVSPVDKQPRSPRRERLGSPRAAGLGKRGRASPVHTCADLLVSRQRVVFPTLSTRLLLLSGERRERTNNRLGRTFGECRGVRRPTI